MSFKNQLEYNLTIVSGRQNLKPKKNKSYDTRKS